MHDRDAWFAGFCDGEATFYIGRRSPNFQLCLRADDHGILEGLQRTFGGRIGLRVGRVSRPSYTWTVARAEDMLRLVAYFDSYPLRAKKAHTYAVWRDAVLLYSELGGGDHVAALRPRLRETLAYSGPQHTFIERPVGRPRREMV